MSTLVTIGLPLYRRMDFLPAALSSVAAQDHPDIDLLISDNGQNSEASIRELIERYYSKPYRFRRNAATVAPTVHYNQLIDEARGDYFTLLCDDDEISSNFVSELLPMVDDHPDTAVAIARQEIIDGEGRMVRHSCDEMPAVMTGSDFLRAICRYDLRLECLVTNLARTADLRRCGGYLDTPRASHSDNALMVKLVLNRKVRLTPHATFRWRIDGLSHGWNISILDLAADTRHFLRFLNRDPLVVEASRSLGVEWDETKRELVKMAWQTYLNRWKTMYRDRLSFHDWALAAFALPPIPAYYRDALGIMRRAAADRGRPWFRRRRIE
jgi:glycosyltransferase involved in cell wall biosynthesis